MINKIYKTIHNKYSKFFKFFFFLRYLFAIFLLAAILFLSIPKFFNYDKKQEIIKEYLVNHYDLEFSNYSSIKFKIFPFPNLAIQNINLKIKDKPIFFNAKNLNIFLNFKNIYNYKNFVAKKISFNKNEITLDIDRTKDLLNYFGQLEYKLNIQDLKLDLKRKDNSIIEIKKIDFSNYGYAKNKIKGEIFDKKFEAYLDDERKNLSFKIFNAGIKANFNFDEINNINLLSGSSKINILNNYLKLNFIVRNDQVEIIKSNLRNKDLLISFDSLVKFAPFFEISSNIYINKIDKKLINSFSLEKILKNREILKKLNSNNKINYNKKRLRNSLIKNYSSELNLAHGRLTFLSKIYILGGVINCKGDSLLIEEYPRLNFDCNFDIKDRKKLLKKFLISGKFNKDPLNLNVVGSINLFNKKINFKKIRMNKNHIIQEEDINYFKETFERILFDESFFGIFKENKIKEFLLEVI
tara:strand:+ start:659 stop:2062 length:1404 start_codon:yes stop_codon:yes gene_type:complete